MHAWLCENPVGVDALTWKELPTPSPKAGEVLIEIKAASLNFPDLLIVQNKYQIKPPLPFVPGSEYAGVVQDRCLLYVFRCAVYYASAQKHEPEKLKWWNWKEK